ncbi:MAG: hypothetical protein AAGC71_14145 [Pseudomonadota bacterium]
MGSFAPGKNIAMKVPPHEYDQTVRFYREILGLPELTPADSTATPRFDFGGKVPWIDKVVTCTHAELWLEITHPEPTAAAAFLDSAGVIRCDDVEPLPDGFDGFWIASPCNVVHLLASQNEAS